MSASEVITPLPQPPAAVVSASRIIPFSSDDATYPPPAANATRGEQPALDSLISALHRLPNSTPLGLDPVPPHAQHHHHHVPPSTREQHRGLAALPPAAAPGLPVQDLQPVHHHDPAKHGHHAEAVHHVAHAPPRKPSLEGDDEGYGAPDDDDAGLVGARTELDCEDPACDDAKPRKATRQQIYWVTYLGLCFCLCFTAYNVAQSFLTTIYPRYGKAAFFAVYMAFGVGSLLAPSATAVIGVKWSIVSGMAMYVVFIFSINMQSPGLLLLMGALNGLGAGLMWITQGTWITMVSEHGGEVGFFTGLFFTITNVSGIIGNVAAMFILQVGLSTAYLIWIMVIVALVAVVGTFFQATVPHAPQRHAHPQQQLSTRQRLWLVAEQLKHRRMQLMLPYMVTQGIGVGITFAVFPTLLPDVHIPRVFLAYGITSCVGSFALGKLYDRLGWQSVVAVHVVCVVGGYVLAMVAAAAGWDPSWQLISGLFLGTVDVASNSITNMTVSEFWGDEAPQGFGVYRCFFSVGTAFTGLIALSLGPADMLTIGILAVLVSAVAYAYLRRNILRSTPASL